MTLKAADIQWRDGQPRAAQFDDIYFSNDAQTEVQRVFIEPSGVLDKAQHLTDLCVAELGFGTGLNFAVLAEQLLRSSRARLRFISFEKFPLRQADWARVFEARAGDLPIYAALKTQPLPLLEGWHQRSFADGRIILSVYHGDVANGLAALASGQANPVNVWFLDGFAPSKNPAMWTPEIYRQMAQLAGADTTVATFTAAGHVRRGLQAAGFEMRRVDQTPIKRESLAGRWVGRTSRVRTEIPDAICIHGAGIGGASMARHLAEAGVNVQVHDPAGVAGGASRIGAAVLHARLLGDGSPHAALRAGSFHYASNYFKRWPGFRPSGAIQLQGPNMDAAKLDRIANAYRADGDEERYWLQSLAPNPATAIAGTPVSGRALYFPTAGVVNLPELCGQLLDHNNIQVASHRAETLCPGTHVICAGTATRSFPGCDHLEIADVHGQLDWYASGAPLARLPMVGNGYLVPTADGGVLGASYEYSPWSEAEACEQNKQLNAHLVGDKTLQRQHSVRGARTVSSDRIPLIGQLPNDTGQIWLATGFGSMGTTAAPFAAAVLAARLTGWLAPVAAAVENLVRPTRFAERQARRGVRHIPA